MTENAVEKPVAGKKTKTLGDLFASKKKKKPTALKIGEEEVKEEETKKDDGKDEGWAEEEKEPENNFLANFGVKDLDAEKQKEEAEKEKEAQAASKQWSKPGRAKVAGPGPAKKYAAAGQEPGAVSEYRFPTLGKGLLETGTKIAEETDKASAARGFYAALAEQVDSDDEGRFNKSKTHLNAAHVTKLKGATEADTVNKALQKAGVDTDAGKMTEEEKQAKKEEKESKERQKELARQKRDAIKAQMKGKNVDADDSKKKAKKVEYDASLFAYDGRLDFEAQKAKYEELEKREWKDIPALVA